MIRWPISVGWNCCGCSRSASPAIQTAIELRRIPLALHRSQRDQPGEPTVVSRAERLQDGRYLPHRLDAVRRRDEHRRTIRVERQRYSAAYSTGPRATWASPRSWKTGQCCSVSRRRRDRNMGVLTGLADDIEAMHGISLDVVSGGNSANLNWALHTPRRPPDRRAPTRRSHPFRRRSALPDTDPRPAHGRLHLDRRGHRGRHETSSTLRRSCSSGLRQGAGPHRQQDRAPSNPGPRSPGRGPGRSAATRGHHDPRDEQRPSGGRPRRSPCRGRRRDRLRSRLRRTRAGDDVALCRQDEHLCRSVATEAIQRFDPRSEPTPMPVATCLPHLECLLRTVISAYPPSPFDSCPGHGRGKVQSAVFGLPDVGVEVVRVKCGFVTCSSRFKPARYLRIVVGS